MAPHRLIPTRKQDLNLNTSLVDSSLMSWNTRISRRDWYGSESAPGVEKTSFPKREWPVFEDLYGFCLRTFIQYSPYPRGGRKLDKMGEVRAAYIAALNRASQALSIAKQQDKLSLALSSRHKVSSR